MSEENNCIDSKVNAALTELNLLTTRVEFNAKRLQSQVLQAYVFSAAMLTFSITSYFNESVRVLVDISMIFALPLLFFAIILSSIAIELRTVYYGQYMAIIEKRINHLLGYDNGLDTNCIYDQQIYKRIVDFERYRLNWGHRKSIWVNIDFVLLALLLLLISFASAIIRLLYSWNLLYLLVLIIVTLSSIVMVLFAVKEYNKQNKKLIDIVTSKGSEYCYK